MWYFFIIVSWVKFVDVECSWCKNRRTNFRKGVYLRPLCKVCPRKQIDAFVKNMSICFYDISWQCILEEKNASYVAFPRLIIIKLCLARVNPVYTNSGFTCSVFSTISMTVCISQPLKLWIVDIFIVPDLSISSFLRTRHISLEMYAFRA